MYIDENINFSPDLFSKANEILYVSDLDTHDIFYLNKNSSDIEKIEKKKCYKMLFGYDKPCENCLNEKMIEKLEKNSNNPVSIRKEVYSKEERKWFLKSEKAFIDSNNRRVKVAIKVDITEDKLLRKELRKKSEEYERIFSLTNSPIFTFDRDGKILLVNSEFSSISGFKASELVGKEWLRIISEKSRKKLSEFVNKRFEGETLINTHRAMLKTKKGGEIPIKIKFSMIDGIHAMGSIVVISDEMKEKERLIKKSSMLLQKIPDAVVVFDENGRIDAYNSQFVQMSLLKGEDREQLSIFDYISKNSQELLTTIIDEKLEETIVNIDFLDTNRSTTKAQMRISYDGEFFYAVVRDITQEIMEANVNMRLQKLASMGEMVTSIAHQWKQPLNTLGLVSYTLVDDESRDSRLEQYNVMRKIIDSMAKTVDDFRYFYKQSDGGDIFSATDLIESTLVLINANIVISHIICNTDVQEDFQIVGIKSELMQVFMILLNNAIDSLKNISDKENRKIWIIIKDRKIVVKDNGVGIPLEYLETIFHPTFTTKESEGTGLGLYMARVIMNKIEGSIVAKESEDGALFEVTFPKKGDV